MPIDYRKEDRIAFITINRPKALNSIDVETWQALNKTMVDFRDDPELWVGIITGAGDRSFCAGADVRDTLPYMKERSHWLWPAAPKYGLDLWKPLIAAINGLALGGGLEIALACDIRIASENASLGTPEVSLGLMPGWGATQRLPRVISWAKAAELLLTGKPIDAQEAYRIGLVNKVVPRDELISTAKEYAQAICQVGPLGVRAAKQAMLRGYNLPLEDGLRLEGSFFDYLLNTEDYKEGSSAFIEKRKPEFKAR